MTDNRIVNLRLQMSGSDPIPQLVGAKIRFRAVYVATRDPAGNLQRVDCWTSRRSDVEVLAWLAEDERFKLPRTLIDQLPTVDAPWVRIIGTVRAQEAGKSLTVRDESGQIIISTVQPDMLPEGATVEVIGRPARDDQGGRLDQPIFRRSGQSTLPIVRLQGPGEAPQRFRLAEQVLELPAEVAEKRYPVTLRGVITWADERADFFYLQDSSGGVRVRRQPGQGTPLETGSSINLTG
jgi:uncharacterized protein YdeI (BOF family)